MFQFSYLNLQISSLVSVHNVAINIEIMNFFVTENVIPM